MFNNRLQWTVLLCMCCIGHAASANQPRLTGEDRAVFSSQKGALRQVRQGVKTSVTGLSAAIVASAASDVASPWFTEARDTLLNSGFFPTVTVIDAGQTTPSLNELLTFDVVLVWSNLAFQDSTLLGDHLGQYVNRGGGVVVAVFATSSTTAGRFLAGRWSSLGYEIIPSGSGNLTGSATLGTILQPAHPTMIGITSFAGGSLSFRAMTPVVLPPAQRIAEWSDGATLVASREDTVGARVDLGFYPPSDNVDSIAGNYWNPTTDGAQLLINSVKFAAERTPLSPGDSNGDGLVDEADMTKFETCFGGSGMTVTAGCAVFDMNLDDDVDCFDWVQLIDTWDGAGSLPPDPFSCIRVVPTTSQYGIIIMGLMMLILGGQIIRKTRAARLETR